MIQEMPICYQDKTKSVVNRLLTLINIKGDDKMEVISKKAAIYIRVSTAEQFEHGFSVDEQRERLTAYCKAMSWDISGMYVDGGFSGKDTNRPALQKMIKEIKLLDIVVIYKLDRLSRSQKDTLTLIEDVLIKNNVDIVSLQENLDTSSPFGRAAIGILSAFSQLERETFKERSLLGRTGRARNGKWVGTSRPPIGYDYNKEQQKLIVNEYEAEQVKKIFELYTNGTGFQKISEILHDHGYKTKYGDWISWGSVPTILSNAVYIGKVKFNGDFFEGEHKPIIDIETFNTAQSALEFRKTGSTFKRKYPFSPFLYCKNCGAKMFYIKKRTKGKVWCYSRWGGTRSMVKDRSCKMKIWDSDLIQNLVLAEIKNIAYNNKEVNNALNKKQKNNSLKVYKNKLEDINKQINKILDLYQYGTIAADTLNNRIRFLHEEKNNIEKIIQQETEKEKLSNNNNKKLQEISLQIIENWDITELAVKIELLSKIIDKIIVDHDCIKILFIDA